MENFSGVSVWGSRLDCRSVDSNSAPGHCTYHGTAKKKPCLGDHAMRILSMKAMVGALSVMAAACLFGWMAEFTPIAAGPINPQVYKKEFEKAKKDADLVAKVRVLAAVCAEAKGEKARTVTLQVSLQVLDVEKGAAKKNDVLVVSHEVGLPTGPGPRSYGYMGALRRFPFTPGVKG